MSASKILSEFETIVALATAYGDAGVAIIRLSGPSSKKVLDIIFKSKLPVDEWQSHHLYYGSIINTDGEELDKCLAVIMKSPHSFTGEDVVEFHVHGGKLLTKKIIQLIQTFNVRLAKPGEFSERAFLNGKMDLTQAEAIADLISAKSDCALKLAQRQWRGDFSKPVLQLREIIIHSLALLEASVDFPDDDIENINYDHIIENCERVARQISLWISDYSKGRVIRDGLNVVLVGKPNVGKSSLLNKLLNEDVAIVHNIAGTTRDPIEKIFNLGSLSLKLIDTAGIRNGENEIESIGIQKSLSWKSKADLVLALFDTSRSLDEDDFRVISELENSNRIFLLTKSDLPSCWSVKDLLSVSECSPSPVVIPISSKSGEGIAQLTDKIPELFGVQNFMEQDLFFINQLRHFDSIKRAQMSLDATISCAKSLESPELLSFNLYCVANDLSEIVGDINNEEVLGSIFSKFCIGK